MQRDMDKQEVTTNEIMDFLREHMPTKEEVYNTFLTKEETYVNFVTNQDLKDELSNCPTKDDLFQVRDDLISHIDGAIIMSRRNEDELVAHQSRMDRMTDGLNEAREHCDLPPMVS